MTLGGLSLTPMISGYFFDGSEQLDPIQSYGLKVGYDNIGNSIADSLGLEGTLNYFTTKSKTDGSDATGYLFRLDITYPFIVGTKWMPFLAIGAGGITIDSVSNNTDIKPLFNYGAGLKYFIEDYLALRFDARHLIVYNNASTRNNFEAGIGVSYYFGKERKKKTIPPPMNKPAIPVLEDDSKAAETKTGEEKKPAVKDSTYPDLSYPPLYLSLAPVPSQILESPARPRFLAEVPQNGTAGKLVRQSIEKKATRNLMVQFDFNSSNIAPEYQNQLKELAEIIKSNPDGSASIEGHTDSIGELKFNVLLSEQRAQNVRSSLIKFGVDPAQISTVSYGLSKPIADNVSDEGRQKNRRVDITVTFTGNE
jgi:OOP family OmpA-OmpF porin